MIHVIQEMDVWDWGFVVFLIVCVHVLVPLMGGRGARGRSGADDEHGGPG